MEIKLIKFPEDLQPFVHQLKICKVMGVDTETTGLNPHRHKLRLIQLAAEGMPVFVVDCYSFLPGGRVLLNEILSTNAVKVFQNAKFDLQFLMALDIYPKPVFDTMLGARLLYMPGMPRRADLKTLAKYYLEIELDKDLQTSNWGETLSESQIQYAAEDASILLKLRSAMVPQIIENGLAKIAEIEFHCVRAVAQMEYKGINIHLAAWNELTKNTILQRDAVLEQLYIYSGRPVAQTTLWGEDKILDINFESNPFMLKLLRQNGIHVDATAKQDLYPYRNHPLVQALSAYRKASKSLSSFLLPIPVMIESSTQRIHPQYGQISAFSGRMSCSNPNIQQIPRSLDFRRCFTAPAGRKLILADYSQIELRVAAQISKDERMIAAYRRRDDLHLLTASLMLNKSMDQVDKQDRQAAKAINFGLIFGMGSTGLAQYSIQSYGVEMTIEQATEFRRRFFNAYQGISKWHQSIKLSHSEEGRTLSGRRYAYSKSAALPELSNSPVQGTAADITKKALGMLADRLSGSDTFIVAVVHDEILVECPAEQADEMAGLLKSTMEQAANSILPLVLSEVEAKVSDNWAEK